MLPDRVSNPGPLTYESGALPIALRGPAANSVDLAEVAHHEPTHLDLHCLPSCFESQDYISKTIFSENLQTKILSPGHQLPIWSWYMRK